jgi:hypothetical protein
MEVTHNYHNVHSTLTDTGIRTVMKPLFWKADSWIRYHIESDSNRPDESDSDEEK